ncbi:hypothetical protein K431DRAFT_73464 [Polychaeton citri CBS 116435]|uniref:Mitochondrial distribution and morphology protein 12 n=1 Tax=Polychaeton citri CBS 116435 TaxID=1314669 RepID=A0A9P4QB15_9PEZI|nr:hypothetical protein K431DRAFT_73464 [Polychaeton citri CBS 116435]
MSVDINWDTLTKGPDGEALAETIRAFIHDRFQQINLPRLIRSVKCHRFEFGTITPQIELKDLCDPLPDFYENEDDESDVADGNYADEGTSTARQGSSASTYGRVPRDQKGSQRHPELELHDDTHSGVMSGSATPGVFRGTANLGYFHLPLSAGLSGTTTPLAAVAGARFANGQRPVEPLQRPLHKHAESFSSISPSSSAASSARPPSQSGSYFEQHHGSSNADATPEQAAADQAFQYEPSPNDLQVVFHATYVGDVKVSLTADVFLDYPMPSFVGIPLKLNITGVRFDGVGILAYIKRKAHLCFLSSEDADALVGSEGSATDANEGGQESKHPDAHAFQAGGLIEEIKIESEIGETDNGKQVLKNVGKIEKFILEKVQQIFEDEFVYPSYWTFLV